MEPLTAELEYSNRFDRGTAGFSAFIDDPGTLILALILVAGGKAEAASKVVLPV